MKNTMKRILCTVLVVVMLVTAMPFSFISSSVATSISIGDKITLGTYNGEPIVWICVDIDDNGPLMLSEDVLCKKQFDAAGDSSVYHSDGWGYVRKERGSNCWYDSNIRQWLNTSGSVAYTHCPPSYSNEDGFMSNFPESALNYVKKTTQKTYVNSWEAKRSGYINGGSYEVPDSYNITGLNINYSPYWYQNITDYFFLLNQEQLYKIYSNNVNYVYSDASYFTRIAGNSGASYEHVFVVTGKNEIGAAPANLSYGIRPAFYLNVDVYENNSSQFPKGYNFSKDKFPFENPIHSIPYTSFANFFGPLWGAVIYGFHSQAGEKGTCFGMATATGALLKNYTSLNDITYKNLFGLKLNPDCINDIWNGSSDNQNFYIDSLNMTVSDYIDYGFLYQWGPWESWIERPFMGYDTIKTIYDDVYDFVYNDGEPVVLNFVGGFSGHSILAVGLKENSTYEGIDCTEIIVDDSNYLKERSLYLLKNDEGKYYNWVFHFTDSEIWTKSSHNLYTCKPSAMFINAVERMSDNLTYTLYEDYRLLTVDKEISLDSAETIIKRGLLWELTEGFSEVNTQETELTTSAYWLKDSYDEPLVFTSDESGGSISYSTYDKSISVDLPYDTTCSINESDDNYINAEISNVKDKTISIYKTEANSNNEKYVLKITGYACSDITATQTETGLLVTGISDGTVTLTKDDEVIETKEIKDAVGEIEITYDKNGEDEEVELDYHSHSYTSSITTPATHLTEGVETFTCSCGDSYTKPVAKLEEHTYVASDVVAPSCEKGGYTVYTCECGHSYNGDKTSATGHSYVEGVCSACGESKVDNCSCNCHKSGFMGFIWKIINLFNKLFKMNKTCGCGVSHY